ncbi:MAG: type IIA DNA topoisomerase subunit B [Oscillospiraceae bacterium]|nr:type IIA DNA topoisomerase subunit B [Oscillospiraceae bacterium]
MAFDDAESLNTTVSEKYDADSIQVLEGLEAVRLRPGMYIGSTGPRGLHHLVYEIIDNSIDEALAGYCTEINVEILPGDIIGVRDNGRGIPVGINEKLGISSVEVVLTVLHAGGKFGGSGYKVSGGLHGVGSSVVNALSEWLVVEVSQEGHVYRQKFERGKPVTALEVIGDTDRHGTYIQFKPDAAIFTETTVYDFETLERRIRESAFLNAGLKMTLDDTRDEAEPIHKSYMYKGGISEYVRHIDKRRGVNPLAIEKGSAKDTEPMKPIHFTAVKDDKEAEIALQYNDSFDAEILSYANNVRTTDGGTHENGFKNALTIVLNDYYRQFILPKEEEKKAKANKGTSKDKKKDKDKSAGSERKLVLSDVLEGLTVVISVKLTDAQFEGQTKAKLGNTDMQPLVHQLVKDKLMQFLETNPKVAEAILTKTMEAAKARIAAQTARDNLRKKKTVSLPGKLADCISKNPAETEIYIVEGDSAGGSAKTGRDPRYQAILPLWGKMLNVEKVRNEKVLNNEKLLPVVIALGAGIERNREKDGTEGAEKPADESDGFDITKLRYNKVIIMADADVDGAHIRTLLLTFFYRFMRPLVEEGHVYIAQPPLYLVSKGQGKNQKVRYAFSDEERDRYMAELGENCDIQRYKGLGEMDPEQLWETTMDPSFRTMLQVTIDDASFASETFTTLMGDEVKPRREFIETHAKYVQNLDV